MLTAKQIAASHRERIGCSQIAQALGASPFGTAYQLWEQYTGRAPWPDLGGNLRVALGEPMEAVLRPFVAQRLGRELRRDRCEYVHPSLPIVGHVDYRASRLKGETARPIVDMKTSLGFGARHRFGDDGTDEVDDGVLLQMQGYMMLTGADTSFVAALVPGPELKVFTVRADPEVHDLITDGIARFWRCVQSNTPPPPQTQGDLRRLYPTDNGNAVEAPPEIERAVESLRETAARIKALEGQRTALEVAIKGHIGEAATLTDINGKTLATWKTQAATRLDTTRLKAEAPDLYAKFATTSTTRVLRLPGGAR